MTAPADMEISARAYGVRFRIRVDNPSILPAFMARLPPGTRTCRPSGTESFCCSVETRESVTGQPDAWLISLDNDVQSLVGGEAEALDTFESHVRFEVARRTPRWTFVHAGVVGWHNRAIVIPGKSYSGKSTLVRALVRAGAAYYSDEFAVLDQRGLVYPFAQPLMHRTGTGTRKRLSVDELAGTSGRGALPVGMVVVTRYEQDATWNPGTLTPGEGLLAMLANTVRAQAAPARVMRTLARVAETAAIVESPRGDAGDTAATLLNRDAAWSLQGRSIA
jgi:hypothetical protein